MPEYTITKVHEDRRNWQSGRGQEMVSYRIDLEGEPKPPRDKIELAQLATTKAPQAGDKLTGQINERKWGANNENTDYKFEKERSGGGGGGGKRSFIEIEHPEIYAARQAAIIRQSQHTAAIEILDKLGWFDGFDPNADQDVEEVTAKIAMLAEHLHADVNKAAGEAFARRGGTCALCGAKHEKGS